MFSSHPLPWGCYTVTKSGLNPILYCQIKGALIGKLICFLAVNTNSTTYKVTLSLIILKTHQLLRDRVDLLLQVEQKFSVDPLEGRGRRGKRRRENRERERGWERGRKGWRKSRKPWDTAEQHLPRPHPPFAPISFKAKANVPPEATGLSEYPLPAPNPRLPATQVPLTTEPPGKPTGSQALC